MKQRRNSNECGCPTTRNDSDGWVRARGVGREGGALGRSSGARLNEESQFSATLHQHVRIDTEQNPPHRDVWLGDYYRVDCTVGPVCRR